MTTYRSQFAPGDVVYLRAGGGADLADGGIVVGVAFLGSAKGPPQYQVVWSDREESQHYDIELTDAPYRSDASDADAAERAEDD